MVSSAIKMDSIWHTRKVNAIWIYSFDFLHSCFALLPFVLTMKTFVASSVVSPLVPRQFITFCVQFYFIRSTVTVVWICIYQIDSNGRTNVRLCVCVPSNAFEKCSTERWQRHTTNTWSCEMTMVAYDVYASITVWRFKHLWHTQNTRINYSLVIKCYVWLVCDRCPLVSSADGKRPHNAAHRLDINRQIYTTQY